MGAQMETIFSPLLYRLHWRAFSRARNFFWRTVYSVVRLNNKLNVAQFQTRGVPNKYGGCPVGVPLISEPLVLPPALVNNNG